MFSNRLRKGTKSKLDSSWQSYTVHIHFDYFFAEWSTIEILFSSVEGHCLNIFALKAELFSFLLSSVHFVSFLINFYWFFSMYKLISKGCKHKQNTQITFTQYPYTAPCLRAQNRQMQSRSAEVNYPLNMKVLNERKRKALRKKGSRWE